MSPINVVRVWNSYKNDEINIDIAGTVILDYMDLYKWYSTSNLESYSLDYVAKHELEKGKLDYSEYKNLNDLYEKDWNKYVDYNVIDSLRVYQLEEKLGFISLVQALSLLTKAPMKYYHTMTQLIEGALLTYYRRNDFVAPHFSGGTQETFEAAYVKEPHKGMHSWVVDLDITSSYPTAIITLNMSPETYFGRILGFTEEKIIAFTRSRNFQKFDMLKDTGLVKFTGKRLDKFNQALSKRLLCVSPCGSVFSNKNPGILSTIQRNIFQKRKEVKNKMIKTKKSLKDLRGEELENAKEKTVQLFDLQWALKILLNAMFGILAVPYSRYFNTNIAEGITSCGRHTIRAGEKYTNELLNKPDNYKPLKDFIEVLKDKKI
jgi:DNA polymerase elongation subunit (family B)